MEKREIIISDVPVEVRAAEEGASKKIVGEAIVFERESHAIFGEFVEVIKRGALDDADMARVVARGMHDDAQLLGTTMGGTLKLNIDDQALRYEVDIPDTTAGRDMEVYIARGDISGSSFAFTTPPGSVEWTDRSADKKLPLREIHKIDKIYDVSPVINPAYPEASSGLRELALRELHDWQDETQRSIDDKNKLKADSTTLAAIHSHKKRKQ